MVKHKPCRLCLESVLIENADSIGEIHKEILEALLIKLVSMFLNIFVITTCQIYPKQKEHTQIEPLATVQ